MLLKWNGTHVWSIGTGIEDGSVLQFIPGPNEITKAQWEGIKEHPVVKARLEKDTICKKTAKIVKLLEIIGAKKVSDDDSNDEGNDEGETGLGNMSAPDAKKLVAETFNTELLRKWEGEETRSTVAKLITKQLKTIEDEREGDKPDADLEE